MIVGTWTPWIPLAFLGFPPAMILAQQRFNLFYQFWIHTEAVHRMPAWFEYLFNTPSHHRVHHASNPRYLDRNYAGVLMVWDRRLEPSWRNGTRSPPRYGIVKNIQTFNPIRIAFHEWARHRPRSFLPRDRSARPWASPSALPVGAPTARGLRPRISAMVSRCVMAVECKLTSLSGNEIYCLRLKGLTPSGVVVWQQRTVDGICRQRAFLRSAGLSVARSPM